MKPDPGTEIRFPVPGSFHTVEPITEGTEMKTYSQVHSGLHWYYGRASDFPCATCGGGADDWAYQYVSPDRELTDERGRKYSEEFSDYAAMCRSCHRRYDMTRPERREWQLEHLKRINDTAKKDPDYLKKMSERGKLGNIERRRRKEAGILSKKRRQEGLSELGSMVGNLRRRCLDCGMETSAGPLVRHQRVQNHSGWETV